MIHYITSNGVGNAWVGNELRTIGKYGVPFKLHSLYKPDCTFFESEEIKNIDNDTNIIYPLTVLDILGSFFTALFVFRTRFLQAFWNSLTGERESFVIRLKGIYQFIAACKWSLALRNESVSHIHSQWINSCGTVGMYGAWLLDVPFSFTGHAADLFRERIALKDKIRRANFIVCISNFHKEFYIKEGADPNKLIIVYCGIDLSHFKPESLGEKESAEYLRIISSARLVEKKGLKYLIEACSLLKKKGINFKCTIAGNGPLENELRNLVSKNGLSDEIMLTGEPLMQENIPEFMRNGDIYCLPCVWASDNDVDGLPQMLMEAMACGVPVISTRLVGIPDLVVHGENGLLVEPNDSIGLANAIEKLANDDALAEKFKIQGRQRVEEMFDLNICLRPLIDKYQEQM